MGRVFLALLLAVSTLASNASEKEVERPQSVSLVAVFGNPAALDRRIVQVKGWCVIEPEEAAIYLSKEDSEYLRTQNALWLDVDFTRGVNLGKPLPQSLNWPCLVEARLAVGIGGHMERFPGRLVEIRRLEKTSSRAEYAKNIR